jgi:hypothetical protein
MEASTRAYYSRFSPDHISLTSSTADDIPETNSFIYNPSSGSSETSIASYKTERTVNSRKSRYNALPRHKYAGIGSPNGPSVDAPKVSFGHWDRHHYYTIVTFQAVSDQHPSASIRIESTNNPGVTEHKIITQVKMRLMSWRRDPFVAAPPLDSDDVWRRRWHYLASHRPSAQEALSDGRLDDARDLAKENEVTIDPFDLEIVRYRIKL